MTKSTFDELKAVKFFKKIITLNRFQEPYNVKYIQEKKRLKNLQKAEVYLEPKRGSTMELFCEYS